jgi:hypothetical protein
MHVEEEVGLLGLEPWGVVGHVDDGYGEDEEEEVGGWG